MQNVFRLAATFAAGVSLSSMAMAATPLTTTITANPAQVTTAAQVATAAANNATTTTTTPSPVSLGAINVAKFDTTTGILVGATVGVNTSVATTASVKGTVPNAGANRRVTADVIATGVVSGTGFSFNSGDVAATKTCLSTVGNPACSNFTSASNAGSIVGTQNISNANLAAYAGAGNVTFNRTTTGSTKVTNGANATNGIANGTFTVGDATAANNVYSVTYDYLNFANPSFSGTSNVPVLTLDFGKVERPNGPVTLNFSLFNIGNSNSAGLSLTSVVQSNPGSPFTSTVSPFVNLTGGSSNTYSVTLDVSQLGTFSNTATINLKDFAPGGIGGKTYSLTINTLATVLPEPGTWAMLIVGFGLVGFSQRRRAARTGVALTD